MKFTKILDKCHFFENRPKYPSISAVNQVTKWSKAEDQFNGRHKMELTPIDRNPHPHQPGADVATYASNRVVPVAAVNPSGASTVASGSSIEPTPSVINLVNRSIKPSVGELVYTSVSDPGRRGSEAATAEKDWTIHRPAPEKVEEPPKLPMYQLLIDHVKSLWMASASAVQVQQHVKNQLEASQTNPNAVPGVISTESITYSPTKITKTENI